MKQEKEQAQRRRLRLQKAIENYLGTVAPCRRWARPAQIKAMAKQMVQSNRIPAAVAQALMREAEKNAVRKPEAAAVL